MGWASTDNACSLGLSASKFIILSDSAARALLPGPRGSQEIVESGRSGPLSMTPRACRVRGLQDRAVPLPSFPASLARSPMGLLQCVINFTFPVCRRGEKRLCPSSGPACPRGHQLKALIGQQYIKVAPGSGSSERQESISWAFVSKHRNTEEEKKPPRRGWEWRVCCTAWTPLCVRWEPLSLSLLSYSRLCTSNDLSCFSVPTHLTYIPQERRPERFSLPWPRTQTGPV